MSKAEDRDFSVCMPYQQKSEFQQAWVRLLKSPRFVEQVTRLFPKLEVGAFVDDRREMASAEEFQQRVISRVVAELEEQTTDGLSVSGLENLARDQKYLILSNHRDIICDPAWVCYLFFLNQIPTPKICLGDNLLSHSVTIDLVKMNKGITVKRGLSPRELLRWSILLSESIEEQIRGEIDSVWIAQQEGRAKDGDDRTHPGVLKMLAMAGGGSTLENLKQLHLLPLAISYEFDPCDAMKAYELYVTHRDGHYKKVPGEDSQSMMTGIMGFKGRVHLGFGTDLYSAAFVQRDRLTDCNDGQKRKETLLYFCSKIDEQIHTQYRLWPSNFIALDLLEGSSHYSDEYTGVQKAFFVERMESQFQKLRATSPRPELRSEGGLSAQDLALVRNQLLSAYAMPVRNFLNTQQRNFKQSSGIDVSWLSAL